MIKSYILAINEKFKNLKIKRLSDFFFASVILFTMVGMTGGFDPAGWLFSLLVDVAQSMAAIYILYWGGRRLNKKRTHQLNQEDQVIQGYVHLLCISIVVGFCFS